MMTSCGVFSDPERSNRSILPFFFLIEDLEDDRVAFSLKGNTNLSSCWLILGKDLNHNCTLRSSELLFQVCSIHVPEATSTPGMWGWGLEYGR